MARFFLPKQQISGRRGVITGQELIHLRKVLRLMPGDELTIFDDFGWEHRAVLRAVSPGQGEIEILDSYQANRESPLRLILAVALTKGEKMDFVVEKATELGVHTIIPFASAYSVPRLDGTKATKRSERWSKIALSAVKQCGRVKIPEIEPLCEFDHLVTRPWGQTLKCFFWEKEQEQTLRKLYENESNVAAVLVTIGPEGGFTQSEASSAIAQGFRSVSLGKRILRAETAVVTAMTLAQYLWGDLR